MKNLLFICCFLMCCFSCEEEFDCENYAVLEGEMSLNGSIYYPIEGTDYTETEVFGENVVNWTVKGVDESCELHNTILLSVSIPIGDPIIGTFDFSVINNIAGQVIYDIDLDGNEGKMANIVDGVLVVEDESNGVLTLDFDGRDDEGDFIDLELRYKFL